MILGKTLDEVLEEVTWGQVSYVGGIAAYLLRYNVMLGTGFAVQPDCSLTKLNAELDIKGHTALLAVESESMKNTGHWVFFDGETIRDPSPSPPRKYKLQEYWAVTYFQPPNLDDPFWWEPKCT